MGPRHSVGSLRRNVNFYDLSTRSRGYRHRRRRRCRRRRRMSFSCRVSRVIDTYRIIHIGPRGNEIYTEKSPFYIAHARARMVA
jgi:hypothetical protein